MSFCIFTSCVRAIPFDILPERRSGNLNKNMWGLVAKKNVRGQGKQYAAGGIRGKKLKSNEIALRRSKIIFLFQVTFSKFFGSVGRKKVFL